MSLSEIKVIAFDADDTLWVNEVFFRKAEEEFCEFVSDVLPTAAANKLLFEVAMQNLDLYGYGVKPFILSLIETAFKIPNKTTSMELVEKLIKKGKEMLQEPVKLIDGIEDTLKVLSEKYRLVMATKGDLLDQERKLIKSGLEKYFHHIEIVSDKTEKQYQRLIQHLDIKETEFLMVGNSLKSDILPVLNIGAHAFHIPFHTTWIHETIDHEINHPNFASFSKASEFLDML